MKVHHSCGLILRSPSRKPGQLTKHDGFHKGIFSVSGHGSKLTVRKRDGCPVKFSFCWSGAHAASPWWSSGRGGSRCCRCDARRLSPYLWPCSSLRRSGSSWNVSKTWQFVLQTGHWSDSSRCGNCVSGYLKSEKNEIVTFRTSSIFTLNGTLILYCWFQVLYNSLDFGEPDCF